MREPPSDAPCVTVPVDDAELLRSPHLVHARMRALGPVVWNRAAGMYFVTRYAEVVSVLSDPALFSSRRDVDSGEHLAPEARAVLARGYAETSILVNDDPPSHTRLRALVNKAFTKSAIAALEPSIRARAEDLVAQLATADEPDVVAGVAVPLPLSVICSVMGVDPSEGPRLKAWSRSWAALTHNRALSALEQARSAEDLLAWQRFTGELVEERRRAPREDLLSRLVEAREEGFEPLTTPEIAVFTMGLLFAGHETTTNLVANTVVQVIGAGLWRRLAEEPRLVPKAIEETLRLEPPVQGMIRRATRDAELAGVRIPRGEQLFLVFASANRDEARYAEPDRFDLDRAEPLRHLGFGHGIHFCLGSQLARMEARAAIVALTTALEAPEIAEDELRYPPSLVHRGPERLRLTWPR